MRNTFVLAIAVCFIAFSGMASAEVIVDVAMVPTPGLDGYTTFNLTANTTEGALIGFNFDASNDSGLGFVGPMNQVNPASMATVFNDINAFFGPTPVEQDSQFTITSTTGISVNGQEGPDILAAAFNLSSGDAGAAWEFAQICIPDGEVVDYAGQFTIKLDTGNVLADVSGSLTSEVIPEPSTFAILGIALIGLGAFLRKR